MPLTRTPHWAQRELHDFLLANAARPFAWGANDCCLFPANAIQSFTGVDLAAAFRGLYSDEAGALRAIASIAGGKTVGDAAAWCAEQHGLAELVHPLQAQRGDLVTLANGATESAGIVGLNGRTLITVGPRGLVTLPITAIQRAWRI